MSPEKELEKAILQHVQETGGLMVGDSFTCSAFTMKITKFHEDGRFEWEIDD